MQKHSMGNKKHAGVISVFGAFEHHYDQYAKDCTTFTDERLEEARQFYVNEIAHPSKFMGHDYESYARRFLPIVEAEQQRRASSGMSKSF